MPGDNDEVGGPETCPVQEVPFHQRHAAAPDGSGYHPGGGATGGLGCIGEAYRWHRLRTGTFARAPSRKWEETQPVIGHKRDAVPTPICHAMLVEMEAAGTRKSRGKGHVADEPAVETAADDTDGASAPPMAVSIAGVSTACSKQALASSAKAVREALSSE